MDILIVDDSQPKIQLIASTIREHNPEHRVEVRMCVESAIQVLRARHFDVVVLDLLLPLQVTTSPVPSGGATLLERIETDREIRLPSMIVGLSADEAALRTSKLHFDGGLVPLLAYSRSSLVWRQALQRSMSYTQRRVQQLRPDQPADLQPAAVLITALENPEGTAVQDIFPELEFCPRPDSPDIYMSGEINGRYGPVKIFHASIGQMGSTAAAVITSRMIQLFRPRVVVMTGICAAVRGNANLGDLIVADPTWEHTAGKLVGDKGSIRFEPQPDYRRLNDTIREEFMGLTLSWQKERDSLANLAPVQGKRDKKPGSIILGPMACGTQVVAADHIPQTIKLTANRKVAALDMESYGVALACGRHIAPRPDYLVIKSACDFADEVKDDKWQKYCAAASAQLARHWLQSTTLFQRSE